MATIQERIERLGGIASLRELVRDGAYRDHVLLSAYYGKIVRVREGWYALDGNRDDVLEAWRIGGRLACVSALAYHGLCDPPAQFHVVVPANASRLRGTGAVIHWSRRALDGDRRAVTPPTATRQSERCRAAR